MFFYFKYEELMKCYNVLNLGQEKKVEMQYWQGNQNLFGWFVLLVCFPKEY